LLRSGRLIERLNYRIRNEDARTKIMRIHSRKMKVSPEVAFEELSRGCEDFNGAQLKAVCVEAGMLALRREVSMIMHEDFVEAITVVSAKKKGSLDYFA
jgi:26S proteasome regulatory subunit T5